jgi:hypothetical protein
VTYGIAYGAKTPVKTAGIEDLLSHHNEMEPRATKRICQSLVESLTHIARTTRLDIAVPTSLLVSRMETPSVKNFEAALRVLQYLWQTRYTSHTLSAPTKKHTARSRDIRGRFIWGRGLSQSDRCYNNIVGTAD